MPNWCENILTIEDCSPELNQYLQDNGFSFEKMIPTPPELLDGDGWYNWRVANWGTKWDLDEREQREVKEQLLQDNKFSAAFMTAWSPPCQAIAALSEQFPNDKFTLNYLEFGMGFAGTAHIHDGISIEDDIFEDDDAINRFAADVFGYDYEELTEEQDQ